METDELPRPAKHRNLCTGCDRDFSSVTAFDMHRTGKFAHNWSEEHPDGRRCRTAEEMREKGMHQGQDGRWRSPGGGAWWASGDEDPADEAEAA